jgi:hypothetical protein
VNGGRKADDGGRNGKFGKAEKLKAEIEKAKTPERFPDFLFQRFSFGFLDGGR